MSSKTRHTFSIGAATSNSLVISIGGLPLERAAAAEAAEVVGHAVPPERIGVPPGRHGHPAHRIHHVPALGPHVGASISSNARPSSSPSPSPSPSPSLHTSTTH